MVVRPSSPCKSYGKNYIVIIDGKHYITEVQSWYGCFTRKKFGMDDLFKKNMNSKYPIMFEMSVCIICRLVISAPDPFDNKSEFLDIKDTC